VAWYSFGGFLGNVIAGLVVLGIGSLLVERTLHLRDRADRAKEAEEQRRQNREAVLSVVHAELESNAAQLTTALEELPNSDQRILYPLFDVTLWPVVSSAEIFTTLKRTTAEALMRAYNRMKTANDQNALLIDYSQGPTSILVTTTVASSINTDELVAETYGKFLDYRNTIRAALIDRLHELKPRLDESIDAVEAELGLQFEQTAGQRVYRPTTRPGDFAGPTRGV
jgi:hypothetical protein